MMNFDEWLENDLSFWEALECGLGQSRNAKLLRLVRAYREYLRHLLSDEQVQVTEITHVVAGLPCKEFPRNVTALEAALMGEEKE